MAKATFDFNLTETFPHLSRPPIVEAIIHWQARAQNLYQVDALCAVLAEKLPGYQIGEPIQEQELAAMIAPQDDAPKVQYRKRWQGFRLTSADNSHVVHFTRDGVVFSRTRDYQDWEHFSATAKPIWRVFVEIGAPVEVQRLGVRFINHIPAATPDTLEDFLREPPTCPSNLPLKEFVYQSTFTVPDQPFGIRVIKVMQPSLVGMPQSSGLFLDCDVYTTRPISCDDSAVDDSLLKMHWLKNKIFFTLLKDEAIQNFQ